MLNYLILGQDGSLGGYERADVLLCDLATNEAPKMIWRRTDELRSRFIPSSVDEVKRDREIQKANERWCKSCGGRDGHKSPFCRELDLTDALEVIA